MKTMYQTKEELSNFTFSIEVGLAVLLFRESMESLDVGRTLRSMSIKRYFWAQIGTVESR